MALLALLMFGVGIYFVIRRYQNTEKKAEQATSDEEKEVLLQFANKQKKQAYFTIGYMILVLIVFAILIFL